MILHTQVGVLRLKLVVYTLICLENLMVISIHQASILEDPTPNNNILEANSEKRQRVDDCIAHLTNVELYSKNNTEEPVEMKNLASNI